jgi:hypothetical protein
LIRDAVTMVLPELIEPEATERIGASSSERHDTQPVTATAPGPRF